jgi:MazG family protein
LSAIVTKRNPDGAPIQPDVDLRPLLDLVTRLRAPDGCPWDREQTTPDLRAYLLEEAHEAAAAIDGGDPAALLGELGDLQFQIVFLASLAADAGQFHLADVLARIRHKMIARHPHVFGEDAERLASADDVRNAWERRKAREKDPDASLLDGVAASVPALLASYRLTQKAAGVGFDWPHATAVLAQVHEELAEVEVELAAKGGPSAPDPGSDASAATNRAALREELGDLLFAVANLARHLDIDPEAALAAANLKFRRRFHHIERRLAEAGKGLHESSLVEMDALWDEAKRGEGGRA